VKPVLEKERRDMEKAQWQSEREREASFI